MTDVPTPRPGPPTAAPASMRRYDAGRGAASGMEPAGLADILDRILDKGLVIAGDISISLAQVELITIKIRLLLASADKAREMGIDWWTRDPALSGAAAADDDDDRSTRALKQENRELRQRLASLESKLGNVLTGGESVASRSEPISAADLLALREQRTTPPAPPAPRSADPEERDDDGAPPDEDEAQRDEDEAQRDEGGGARGEDDGGAPPDDDEGERTANRSPGSRRRGGGDRSEGNDEGRPADEGDDAKG